MCSPYNEFNFYCKITKKYVIASIYSVAIVMNDIEKWPYTSYSGGNSTFYILYKISYSVKHIKNILPLY